MARDEQCLSGMGTTQMLAGLAPLIAVPLGLILGAILVRVDARNARRRDAR